MLAVMAVMASLTSCMKDNNDWGVDPTANGNRTWAPIELKAEKGDTFIKIFGFKATNATSYEAQVSKVNFAGASEEDIKKYNFTREDMTPVETHDTMTLNGLEPKTTYYVRVKAKAEGKEDSQWVEYISSKGENTIKTEALAIAAAKVEFAENYAAGTVPAYFHDKTMTIYVNDKNGKMSVDGSSKNFTDGKSFSKRLKTGAVSSANNGLTISVSVDGTLTIYPFASSSSKTSSLIVTQNGNELLNVPALTGSGDGEPYVISGVKAGKVEISYPLNGVNFYGFAFEMEDGQEYVEDKIVEPEPEPEPTVPSLIKFSETTLPMTWTDGDITLNAVCTDGKMAIDGSNKSLDGQSFTHRLKTGAPSTDGVNGLTVTAAKDGTLTVYVLSASSSAEREVLLVQNEVELSSVTVAGTLVKITATVKAGTVNIFYPDGAVNFYGFKFEEEAAK